MKVVGQIIKFLSYAAICIAEYVLMMLLDIIKQLKKLFQ